MDEWEQAKSLGQKYGLDSWTNYVESLKDDCDQPISQADQFHSDSDSSFDNGDSEDNGKDETDEMEQEKSENDSREPLSEMDFENSQNSISLSTKLEIINR